MSVDKVDEYFVAVAASKNHRDRETADGIWAGNCLFANGKPEAYN